MKKFTIKVHYVGNRLPAYFSFPMKHEAETFKQAVLLAEEVAAAGFLDAETQRIFNTPLSPPAPVIG